MPGVLALDRRGDRQVVGWPIPDNATARNVHPNVALPYLFPGVVLWYRGVADFKVLVSPRLMWLVVGIAALLWFSAIAADRTLHGKFGTLLALAGLTLAHRYGLAATNVWLDRSPGTTYRVAALIAVRPEALGVKWYHLRAWER